MWAWEIEVLRLVESDKLIACIRSNCKQNPPEPQRLTGPSYTRVYEVFSFLSMSSLYVRGYSLWYKFDEPSQWSSDGGDWSCDSAVAQVTVSQLEMLSVTRQSYCDHVRLLTSRRDLDISFGVDLQKTFCWCLFIFSWFHSILASNIATQPFRNASKYLFKLTYFILKLLQFHYQNSSEFVFYKDLVFCILCIFAFWGFILIIY